MKTRVFLQYGLVLLMGMALGAFVLHLYHTRRDQETLGRTLDSWAFDVSTGKIIHNVNTLVQLRRGQTEYVVDLLERDLSAEIHLLSLGFPTQTMSDTNSLRILKTVSRYRKEHPFKSGDAERDKAVEGLLSSMD